MLLCVCLSFISLFGCYILPWRVVIYWSNTGCRPNVSWRIYCCNMSRVGSEWAFRFQLHGNCSPPPVSLCHSLYPNLFLSLLFALHHTFHPAVWSRRGTPVYWSIHYLLLIQLLKVRLNRGMKMNWFSQQSSLNEIHRFNLKYCLLLFSQASLPMLLLPPSGEWTGGHTSTPIISAVCKVYDCGWCYCHWNCFGNIGPH